MVSKGVTSRVSHGRCVLVTYHFCGSYRARSLNCQEDGTRALFLAKQPTAEHCFFDFSCCQTQDFSFPQYSLDFYFTFVSFESQCAPYIPIAKARGLTARMIKITRSKLTCNLPAKIVPTLNLPTSKLSTSEKIPTD